ncbi:putative 3-oxoacyl-(Acyl carrier protein) synthase II [uncultured Desulfobacterium sp.]|uniref:Putative 3-oxoacyl-(Acyl carrier protein) synthase II n=1 Tax=uncultured Desulfobacterium sp. TaxID=201089 RepID=A0A445MZ93_9BACT|nr:putative 3-oxoacyl-(Acyl carrier protein) synthase II [uncultured Desulfobacterium sp.]
MGSRTAVIIGYDIVSPLGITLETQWEGAIQGESGIGMLTRFPVSGDFPVTIAGQVEDIDHLPYQFLMPRERAGWTSPVFRYAMLTVARALERSGLEISPDLAPRVAVTYSSAIGGLDAVLDADRRMIKEGKLPHPFTNPNSCINMVGGKISMLTGATGPITSTITACATGLTSMIIGSMLLEQNRADIAICGAVDFALVEPIVAGFSTMNGSYHPKEGVDEGTPQEASRPFSIHRRGFVLSEGAGCIIIASKEVAKANGLNYSIEMAGWSMTSDAYHFVSPNLETVKRCIAEGIINAGISAADIAAVNAHAASTKVGDRVEFDALNAVFNGSVPPVTANKSLIGHAMGASSAIESVFAIKGMQEGRLPPTINYRPDPDMELDCVAEGTRRLDQEYVLKNAFGFGGCNACVIFRRIR